MKPKLFVSSCVQNTASLKCQICVKFCRHPAVTLQGACKILHKFILSMICILPMWSSLVWCQFIHQWHRPCLIVGQPSLNITAVTTATTAAAQAVTGWMLESPWWQPRPCHFGWLEFQIAVSTSNNMEIILVIIEISTLSPLVRQDEWYWLNKKKSRNFPSKYYGISSFFYDNKTIYVYW